MFLAQFPHSEVFYAISIFLAWLYIALGIIGNNQAAMDDVAAYKYVTPVQESHFLLSENISLDHRTFIWEHCNNSVADKPDEPAACFHFVSVKAVKFKTHTDHFTSFCPNSIVPDRAPPAII